MGAHCGSHLAARRPGDGGSARTASAAKEAKAAAQPKPAVQRYVANIRGTYDIDEATLGEGTFGVVRRGTRKATGTPCAVKCVPRGGSRAAEALRKEIAIMKSLDHPNIIQLHETFEDRRCFSLVMELCTGGELFDRIAEAGCFSDADAAATMRQILQAVQYMHGKNIVHRDLKPENFIFQTEGPVEDNCLKLIDFGAASLCGPGKVLKSKIGTALYMAPQVVMGRYDRQCDLWSAGCVLYLLLSGRLPFGGADERAVMASVRQGRWSFAGTMWHEISADAKDLVQNLLYVNPRRRHTAAQALQHQWIQRRDIRDLLEPTKVVGKEAVRQLSVQELSRRLQKELGGFEVCVKWDTDASTDADSKFASMEFVATPEGTQTSMRNLSVATSTDREMGTHLE